MVHLATVPPLFVFTFFCLVFAFLKEEVESSIRVCCVSLFFFFFSLFADCKSGTFLDWIFKIFKLLFFV